MWRLLKELTRDEGAQDVVEYALVTAAFGLAGAAAWPLVVDAIGNVYQAWNGTQQDLWEPPPPTP